MILDKLKEFGRIVVVTTCVLAVIVGGLLAEFSDSSELIWRGLKIVLGASFVMWIVIKMDRGNSSSSTEKKPDDAGQ